jgi:hypothetical protein
MTSVTIQVTGTELTLSKEPGAIIGYSLWRQSP